MAARPASSGPTTTRTGSPSEADADAVARRPGSPVAGRRRRHREVGTQPGRRSRGHGVVGAGPNGWPSVRAASGNWSEPSSTTDGAGDTAPHPVSRPSSWARRTTRRRPSSTLDIWPSTSRRCTARRAGRRRPRPVLGRSTPAPGHGQEEMSARPGLPPSRRPTARLATDAFVDICASTERLAEAGDRQRHRTLDDVDADGAAPVDRSGGRVIKTLGTLGHTVERFGMHTPRRGCHMNGERRFQGRHQPRAIRA